MYFFSSRMSFLLYRFYPRILRWFSTSFQPFTVSALIRQTVPVDVHLNGWVKRSQKRGKVVFLHISDGLTTDSVQVVVSKDISSNVPVGSAVSIYGQWQTSKGSQQHMELVAKKCKIKAFDINPRYDDLSPDQLRKSIHLRSRSSSFAALLRIRSRMMLETHKFFMERNYIHIDTPVITANDCEGAGETFSVATGTADDFEIFGKNVFLTVSSQLHLEAMVSGISRVYTLGGGFRAEKQQSSSHLSEFRMLEVEMAFCQNLGDICTVAEDFVRHCILLTLEDVSISRDFKALGAFTSENHIVTLESIMKYSDNFPRLSYDEAIALLVDKKQHMTGNGLNKQNEAFLVDYCKSPVFITNFPTYQKPFYMKRTSDGQKTESFDLLCPIVGELAGGSVREPSADVLRLQGANIDWYLDGCFRGKPISAGFGIGFERLLQVLLGVRNIKDTIAYPRWFKHCQC